MANKSTDRKVTSKKKATSKKNIETVSKRKEKVQVDEKVAYQYDDEYQPKIYIGYGTKVTIATVLFIVLFGFSLFFLLNSFDFLDEKLIRYTEKSNLDYKVNLKKNDFYESQVLGKNMVYVASLIDSIDTYFNYDFSIDENVPVDIQYSIIAMMRIADANGNTYLEKAYPLIKDKKISLSEDNMISINEKINIDYDYYNSIANKFNATYGVDAINTLSVYMQITKNSRDDDFKINNSVSTQLFKIPLSEKSLEIKMDYTDINNVSTVISENDFYLKNILYIVVSIVLLVLSMIEAVKLVRLICLLDNKKSKYDRYVNKLLREYDRLIVESYTIVDFSKYTVIKVKKFEELLDVRDNLKLPVNYYVVVPHSKSYFYIISGENMYLFTLKEIDLEKK